MTPKTDEAVAVANGRATATATATATADTDWVPVCRFDDLEVERGVAALLDGAQVAIFRLADGTVRAVDHHDPFSGANVIARGIVGSRGDTPTVASPMFKDVFDLRTGVCLDKPPTALRVYPVRVTDGVVAVGVAAVGVAAVRAGAGTG